MSITGLADGDLRFHWHPQAGLASVDRAGQLAEGYLYDGLGRLAAIVASDQARPTQLHVFDGDQIVAALDPAGAPLWEATWGPLGDQLVAYVDHRAGGRLLVPILNYQHSPIAVWDPAAARVLGSAAWTPEGRTTTADAAGTTACTEPGPGAVCHVPGGILFGWTGVWRSTVTGLVWLRARWYSPVLAQFLTHDPAGFSDGPNPYAYAAHDPVNRIDPLGLGSQGLTPRSTEKSGEWHRWQDEWLSFPWEQAFRMAKLGKSREESKRDVLGALERAGWRDPEKRANLYIEDAGRVGSFIPDLIVPWITRLIREVTRSRPLPSGEVRGMAGQPGGSSPPAPASPPTTGSPPPSGGRGGPVTVYKLIPLEKTDPRKPGSKPGSENLGGYVTTENITGQSLATTAGRLDVATPSKLAPQYAQGGVVMEATTPASNLGPPDPFTRSDLGVYRSGVPQPGMTAAQPPYSPVPEYILREPVPIPAQPTRPFLRGPDTPEWVGGPTAEPGTWTSTPDKPVPVFHF